MCTATVFCLGVCCRDNAVTGAALTREKIAPERLGQSGAGFLDWALVHFLLSPGGIQDRAGGPKGGGGTPRP